MNPGAWQVAGVILAGGRARRMGGVDKALVELAGQRLIDHVLVRLGPQVAATAISVNDPTETWHAFGLPLLPDSFPERRGPLAGLLAGLDWAAAKGYDAIVTAAADTPFLPRDLVAGLLAARGAQGVAIAASPDPAGRLRPHPVFGLWPVTLREDLRFALLTGARRVGQWAQDHETGQACFDGAADPFFNINTPEDLRRAREIVARLTR